MFGEILLELGYITEKELQWALFQQKTEKKRLGEILLDAHIIEEDQYIEILSCQFGIPTVEPEPLNIPAEKLTPVITKWCKELQFLPVVKDGVFYVAFADPFDGKAKETATSIFGDKYTIAIATRQSIRNISSTLNQAAMQNPVISLDAKTAPNILDNILDEGIRMKASDVHIEPAQDKVRVRFRRDGVMMPFKDYPLEIGPSLASRIKILAKMDIAEKRRHQGGRFVYASSKGNKIEVRASVYVSVYGEKVVMRLLSSQANLLQLDEVGMAKKISKFYREGAIDGPGGVVIITGPTGAGKTTTLYSTINYLRDVENSIITAEDPVEYLIDGVTQCSVNPDIGLTYEETLRHIVRQDPDVIVIGEIRDNFSAMTAIQAALTGHKVLTTLHTEDSIGGVIRLINMQIEAFLISSTVVCVVAQRLVRKICPHCAKNYMLSPGEIQKLGYKNEDIKNATFKIGVGCDQCCHTGYNGRIGVFEVLILNEKIKEAILQGKTAYDIRKISLETSTFVTLFEDGLSKAAKGVVSVNDVFRFLPQVSNPRPLHEIQRLQGE